MKLDRLLAITMLLVNRDRVSAAELAARFEVSSRTIYRDIEAINQAGIPIVSYQGKDGGFAVMESYRIDRQILTVKEMCALLAALRGVCRAVPDREIDGAVEKIQSLLPAGTPPLAPGGRTTVIDVSPWYPWRSEEAKTRLLQTAIERRQLVSFSYTNAKGESATRTVEPMTIVLKERTRYLYGYCRLRGDYRFFRLSRLADLKLRDETFIRRPVEMDERSWRFWESEGPPVDVLLRFDPRARVRVLDTFEPEQITPEAADYLLVRGSFTDRDWLLGTIQSFGDLVEVLSPKDLRALVMEKARAVIRLYEGRT